MEDGMNPPHSQAMTADPSVVAAAVPLLLSKLYTRIYIHQAPVPVEESCRIRNSYIQKTYQNRNVTHHKRTQTRPHEEIRLK
jgi:hypothetical protein